jgi:hypothetical protein
VIGNAVVATKYHGRNKSEQFFCFFIKRARLVGEGINGEKPFNGFVILRENFLIHFMTELGKFIQSV